MLRHLSSEQWDPWFDEQFNARRKPGMLSSAPCTADQGGLLNLAGLLIGAIMIAEADFLILHQFPEPDLERHWRDCLAHVEFPAHYDAPEFFLEPFWKGKRPFVVLAIERGLVNAVLTGCHEGNQVVSGLPSRPQICVADRASGEATSDALARGLLKEAGSASLVTVYAWSQTPLEAFSGHGFLRRSLEGNVVLDLSKGADEVFRQFCESRRRNIRFATKHDVEVFQASAREDFSAFYEVYVSWRQTERKAIEGPEVSFETFEKTYHLNSNRRLFLARYSGKIIAGTTVRFLAKGMLEYAANASMDDYLHLRPNDLLLWKTVEWGCQEGFRRYSLGGAHPFHRRSGGLVLPIHRYRADRTWTRGYDLREWVLDIGREVLHKLPGRLKERFGKRWGRNSQLSFILVRRTIQRRAPVAAPVCHHQLLARRPVRYTNPLRGPLVEAKRTAANQMGGKGRSPAGCDALPIIDALKAQEEGDRP